MRWLDAVVLLICGGVSFGATHTLAPREDAVINSWLRSHSSFRLAVDADCDCQADIRTMRQGQGGVWKPVPDYRPYVVRGDFNGDGAFDFAVAVVNTSKADHKFALLVFNGPFMSSD